MVRFTLNNLVRKSEQVSEQKLAALTDCIGAGWIAATDHLPATFLSSGHISTPRLPEPASERGSRQVVFDEVSKPTAGNPSDPVGRVSGPMTALESFLTPAVGKRFSRRISSTRYPVSCRLSVGADLLGDSGTPGVSHKLDRDYPSPDMCEGYRDRTPPASARVYRMTNRIRIVNI